MYFIHNKSTCVYKHIKLVRSGLIYWVIKTCHLFVKAYCKHWSGHWTFAVFFFSEIFRIQIAILGFQIALLFCKLAYATTKYSTHLCFSFFTFVITNLAPQKLLVFKRKTPSCVKLQINLFERRLFR